MRVNNIVFETKTGTQTGHGDTVEITFDTQAGDVLDPNNIKVFGMLEHESGVSSAGKNVALSGSIDTASATIKSTMILSADRTAVSGDNPAVIRALLVAEGKK